MGQRKAVWVAMAGVALSFAGAGPGFGWDLSQDVRMMPDIDPGLFSYRIVRTLTNEKTRTGRRLEVVALVSTPIVSEIARQAAVRIGHELNASHDMLRALKIHLYDDAGALQANAPPVAVVTWGPGGQYELPRREGPVNLDDYFFLYEWDEAKWKANEELVAKKHLPGWLPPYEVKPPDKPRAGEATGKSIGEYAVPALMGVGIGAAALGAGALVVRRRRRRTIDAEPAPRPRQRAGRGSRSKH